MVLREYLIIFLHSGSHHVGICGPLGVICVFKLHDHTSYQKKKKVHNHTELLYFFFFSFDTTKLLYFTMHKYSKKNTHTQILKKHISKMNLVLQTNKLLTDVFISSKSVYYKAQ